MKHTELIHEAADDDNLSQTVSHFHTYRDIESNLNLNEIKLIPCQPSVCCSVEFQFKFPDST